MQGQWIVFVAVVLGAACVWADCDLRYFQHYEHKGCEAVAGDDGCPKRFQCNEHSDDLHEKCLHNGKWYNRGEPIVEDCDHCRCSGDSFGGSFIECASVDCPDWDTQNKSCYMGYNKLEDCCPTEMCPKESKDQRKKCRQGNQEVDVGRFLQTGDACQQCLCTEDGPQCKKVNCLTGIYAQKIRRGCLPLYNEASCCVTGMYCDGVNGAKHISNPENTDDKCHYQGQYYELGTTVRPTANECFECTCSVPPDFTCLRGRC